MANSPAYDLYIRARAAERQRALSGVELSIELLEQAIAKDPMFAPGYAGVAAMEAARLVEFPVARGRGKTRNVPRTLARNHHRDLRVSELRQVWHVAESSSIPISYPVRRGADGPHSGEHQSLFDSSNYSGCLF